MIHKNHLILLLISLVLNIIASEQPATAQDFAMTVYGGRMTGDDFGDTLTGRANYVDAYIAVGALSWTFVRYLDNALSFEIEGQVGKWFGDQKNMEFNLPLGVRWSKFPWNNYVSTSLAYGLGPSYATKEPQVEKEENDSTKQFLIYWFGELALGPPDSNWSGVLRIHHRSGGFGLIEEQGRGGSNTLAIGVKYRF